jgi:hypothetical protein
MKTGMTSNTYINKMDFKSKSVRQDKSHSILIKGTIHQKEIKLTYMCPMSVHLTSIICTNGLKTQIDPKTVVVGDFNIPLSPTDRLCTQKINKKLLELNDTIEPVNLIYVLRVLHLVTAQYTFFSAVELSPK